jgi:glycosyltransferase involved in cell wall biosynthesis
VTGVTDATNMTNATDMTDTADITDAPDMTDAADIADTTDTASTADMTDTINITNAINPQFYVFVFCGGDFPALEKTIASLNAAAWPPGGCQTVLLFAEKKYELAAETLRAAEEMQMKGFICLFGTEGAKAAREAIALIRDTENEILLFLREGDAPDAFLPKYATSFFAANSESCGVAFFPVLCPGRTELPAVFRDVPPGCVVSADDRKPPASLRGAAIPAAYVQELSSLLEGADENAFLGLLYAAIEKRKTFGLLCAVRVETSVATPQGAAAVRDRLVSCIIPVFNVEKYLAEAIDSVVAQTIGFAENVQLILVNDGSTDDSNDVCRRYREQYPENIIHIEQENQGVSAARNAGLDVATGEFVAFLDGDAVYDVNAFEKIAGAFDENPSTGTVTANVTRSDGKTGVIPAPSVTVHASAFKANAIGDARFDGVCGDISFCIKLIDVCGGVAVHISDCICHKAVYPAKPETNASKDLIAKTLLDALKAMRAADGRISGSAQSLALEYIHCHSRDFDKGDDEVNDKVLSELFALMDDDVIENSGLPQIHKAYLLSLRYSLTISQNRFGALHAVVGHKSSPKLPVQISSTFHVTQIFEKNSVLYIKAYDSRQTAFGCKLQIISDFETHVAVDRDYPHRHRIQLLGWELFPEAYYEIEIDLPEGANDEIGFYWLTPQFEMIQVGLNFAAASNLALGNAFFVGDSFLVTRQARVNRIRVQPFVLDALKPLVQSGMPAFVAGGKEKTHKIDPEFNELKSAISRNFGFFQKRRIWLFMDRHMETDNNAEALFRYCAPIDDGIEKWYVIPKESFKARFDGLNTVVFGTLQFKLLLVFAEKFISSFLFSEGITLEFSVRSANPAQLEHVLNFRKVARQFFRGDIVHLQHGVIFGDISQYLNRRHERFSLICSASEREFEYASSLSHALPADRLKLTGLPKYDELERIKRNQTIGKNILFAPSFDRDASAKDAYVPDYRHSEHFGYVNGILGSQRLRDFLKTEGYTLLFKPHYLMRNNLIDFDVHERVRFVGDEIGRYELYAISDLLITDYSGIAFEYAYLKKPVLYAHIARNTKFEETYFEYERDGFGEIFHTVDSLIDGVVRCVENECEMPAGYKTRVDGFFTYGDTNNCKRVYDETIKLPDTRKDFGKRGTMI